MDDVAAEHTKVTHLEDDRARAPEELLARIAAVAAERGTPIRVRVGVQLFDPSSGRGGQFQVWRGQAWRFDVADATEARHAKEGLELFFDLLARVGPTNTELVMRQTIDHVVSEQTHHVLAEQARSEEHKQEPDNAISTLHSQ